jgi:hypothetical protein
MSAKTSWEQLFPTVRKTIDKFVELPKSRSLWIALAVFYAGRAQSPSATLLPAKFLMVTATYER